MATNRRDDGFRELPPRSLIAFIDVQILIILLFVVQIPPNLNHDCGLYGMLGD